VIYDIERRATGAHSRRAADWGTAYAAEIIARNANIKVNKPLSETALLRGESQLYTWVYLMGQRGYREPITDIPTPPCW